ncbi:MAG: cobalamin biosynthesis protein CbiG, partial [Candidatus Methanomethylophilaceae archaeon]|nr:cobalamin biosynthesis protein CbiG [Candidatus Methanomethylophilaceae archaeon]
MALLSGHIGGCNNLTERIASRMDSEAVITTATDINGKFSVDSFAVANDLRIMGLKIAKDVSARVLDGRCVGFTTDNPLEGDLPDGLILADEV